MASSIRRISALPLPRWRSASCSLIPIRPGKRWTPQSPEHDGPDGGYATGPAILNRLILLAIVHDAVAALDRGARRAANAIASGIVAPAGVAVIRTAPGTAKIVSPHGVPGQTRRRVVAAGRRVRGNIDAGS